ncbi:hypothetical protein NMY22_g1209 [Coprinellus aureogranulatus]|nr:hypothetical protein NMY22_g1209 [Coprinellus aureogranulatus]
MSSSDVQATKDNNEPWYRIPTRCSAFFALATLTPPSPDPSISSCSSVDFDDFPIFLVDSVTESSVESSPANFLHGDLADSTLGMAETGSSTSICSFGTFGQRRGGTLVDSPFSVGESLVDDEYAMDSLCEYYMSASPSPSPTEAKYLEAGLIQQPTAPGPLVPGFHQPKHALDHATAIHNVSIFVNEDGLVSPAPILPVDSCPLIPSPPLKATDHLLNSEAHIAPTQRRLPPVAPDLIVRPRNAVVRRKAMHRTRKEAQSDEVEFVWLHGISVDLLIDQEGFRSATPSFRYAGVTRSKNDKTTCTVTFRATSKQGYNFHYNPFDSLPVLRRVTIHGEESKDYISKQAQLTLKANGVYAVHGAEISSISPAHSRVFNQLGYDPEKLEWEFQYLVEDRTDTYGRAIAGEKKFVPLTFTCSPWLLHPSQGKRVNLMHIFKKGVLGKLTAEKAKDSSRQPPFQRQGDRLADISIHASGHLAAPTCSPTTYNEFQGRDGTHRRAMSHVSNKARSSSGGGKALERAHIADSLKHEIGIPAIPQPWVNRRASFVGDVVAVPVDK